MKTSRPTQTPSDLNRRILVIVVKFRIWHCAYLLNGGLTKDWVSLTEAFSVILWPRSNDTPPPSNPVFVVCCQLSPALEVSYSWIRSSLVYGPGGSSTPWWPPGRAPDWGAGGLRRWVRFRSQLRWLMSLENKSCHLKKTNQTPFTNI